MLAGHVRSGLPLPGALAGYMDNRRQCQPRQAHANTIGSTPEADMLDQHHFAMVNDSHKGSILSACCPQLPHGQKLIGHVGAACLPYVVVVYVQLLQCPATQVALPAASKVTVPADVVRCSAMLVTPQHGAASNSACTLCGLHAGWSNMQVLLQLSNMPRTLSSKANTAASQC